MTNKLPIQERVGHLEKPVNWESGEKCRELCEGRGVGGVSGKSRKSGKLEERKEKERKETSWLENHCVYGESAHTHDNKLKSFGKEF